MLLTLLIVVVFGAFVAFLRMRNRSARRQMEQHCISAEELRELLDSGREILLYDVRIPLDVLTDAEIIPGAERISPKEIVENPGLIPRDRETVVYCTCPGEESSKEVLRRALSMGLLQVRFLRGGLAAWKAKGYAVEPFEKPFHLDTAEAQ